MQGNLVCAPIEPGDTDTVDIFRRKAYVACQGEVNRKSIYVIAHTKVTHMPEIPLALIEIGAFTPRRDEASASDVSMYLFNFA